MEDYEEPTLRPLVPGRKQFDPNRQLKTRDGQRPPRRTACHSVCYLNHKNQENLKSCLSKCFGKSRRRKRLLKKKKSKKHSKKRRSRRKR